MKSRSSSTVLAMATRRMDNMILIIVQLFQLTKKVWSLERWRLEILNQIGGQAISGRAVEPWSDKVKNARAIWAMTTTADAIKAHFKRLVQAFGKQYFGRKVAEDQKDAVEYGELTYEGHCHFSVAKRLFRINDQLKYEKLSDKAMTKKMIATTLHPVARLEYIRRGGKELTTKQAILN